MIEKPVLQKLLPLPYVPKEWQLTALRWWVKLRIPVFFLAAFLLIPVANELFWIIYFALPTAMQLLTAMLALYGWFLLTYHCLKVYDDLVGYIVVLAPYTLAIPFAGIYPDITIWVPMAMTGIFFGALLWDLTTDLWTSLHRRLA